MSDVVPFRCPVCQAERFAARALEGRQARCPECDTLVTVADHPRPEKLSPIDQGADTLSDLPRAALADLQSGVEPSQAKSEEVPAESRMPTYGTPPPFAEERRDIEERPTDDDFDPYYRWLAIPKVEQPPNHYRLLGLQLFENDSEVILNSSERQMAHVKAQAGGRNVTICQRLLSELSFARICLLDPAKKAPYDAELRRMQAEKAKAVVPAVATKKSPPSSPKAQAPAAGPATKQTSLPVSPAAALPETAPIPAPPVAAPPVAAPPVVAPPPQNSPEQRKWKGAPATAESASHGDSEDEAAPEKVVVKRRIVEGEMDMTPMIDVTFLLLIFFICTASFALTMTKPIPAQKEDEPSTAAQSIEEFEDDPDYITVRIDAHNTFRVISLDADEEAPSLQELIVKLRAVRQAGQDGKIPTTLMVIANGQALHEKVVQALDAGTEVGMEKMQLMTVENDDE